MLGLAGNWGRKGTGARSWAILGMDGQRFLLRKEGAGQEQARKLVAGMTAMGRLVAAQDRSMTAEMARNRAAEMAGELSGMGVMIPSAFAWYRQYGYGECWNNPENHDPASRGSWSR